MTATTIDIPMPDGTADAYVAFPDDGRRHPGVLLYMDIIGLRPVIFDMVQQLASSGYYVLAPNFLYRHGRAPVVQVPDLTVAENREPFFNRVKPLLADHTVDRAMGDAAAYLDFLTVRSAVRTGPVGVVGYCAGGVLAVRTAAKYPERVAAVAGFHPGALVTDKPDSPHRLVSHINAEVLLGIADNDFPPQDIDRLASSLDAAGLRHSCEVYPDTIHGFTMADTAAFSPTGLQRHWDELLPVLARNLV